TTPRAGSGARRSSDEGPNVIRFLAVVGASSCDWLGAGGPPPAMDAIECQPGSDASRARGRPRSAPLRIQQGWERAQVTCPRFPPEEACLAVRLAQQPLGWRECLRTPHRLPARRATCAYEWHVGSQAVPGASRPPSWTSSRCGLRSARTVALDSV